MKKFIIIFFILAVLTALSMPFWGLKFKNTEFPPGKPEGYVAEILPKSMGDWTSVDQPLGDTEEVIRSSQKTLNLSDFLFRKYTNKKGKEFDVYIAYWAPGVGSIRSVSGHTPDICWVKNGWTQLKDKINNNFTFNKENVNLIEGDYRELVFETSTGESVKRNVLFWCIVGDKRYMYSAAGHNMPNPITWILNNFMYNATSTHESYFIRISSSEEFEDLIKDASFVALLDELSNILLAKEKISGYANFEL